MADDAKRVFAIDDLMAAMMVVVPLPRARRQRLAPKRVGLPPPPWDDSLVGGMPTASFEARNLPR